MQTITVIPDPKRSTSPWGVHWRAAGTREAKFFATQSAAKKFKRAMEDECADVHVPPGLGKAIKLLLTIPGLSILECVEGGIKAFQAGGGSGVTIESACEKYLAKLKQERAREGTVLSFEQTFVPLLAEFKGRKLGSIGRDEYASWLNNPKWAPSSQAKHHRHARPIWNHLEIAFPGVKWKKPYEPKRPVVYLTLEQVHLMFLACPVFARPTLALMIFGGVRPEAAWQFQPEWINSKDRSIFIPEWADKVSESDVTITDVPQVLFDWLAVYPITQTIDLKNMRRRIRQAGGPKWHQDICRHTAATSWLSVLGMDECRRLLNHAGFTLIRRHYSGDIDKAAARAFLALRPADVYPAGNPAWELALGAPQQARDFLNVPKITPEMVRPVDDKARKEVAAA